MQDQRNWTPDEEAALAALRSEGRTSAEIGRHLGRSRGAVDGHLRSLNLPKPDSAVTDQARFWRKVDRRGDDECWLWRGTKNLDGYGRFSLDGAKVAAHRFAYELFVGPIPEGALIRHTCDDPACVNPAHHIPGTNAENMRDMVERKRSASGVRHGSRKLTIEQLVVIRQRIAADETMEAIARDFGVTHTAIRKIRNGVTWREVEAA